MRNSVRMIVWDLETGNPVDIVETEASNIKPFFESMFVLYKDDIENHTKAMSIAPPGSGRCPFVKRLF